jgi:SAM-dependent methyltransferase
MAKQKSLADYEERYKQVFAAGAQYWNDPRPNIYLSRVMDQLPAHSRCIEFGCGEGYQAYLMASRGHFVTAIDLSITAIEKAIRNTPENLYIEFITGDVTEAFSLNLRAESYDLAVDIGCLHMMTEDEDRTNYLKLVYTVLKRGGQFFLENGLDIGDISPESEDEAKRIDEIRKSYIEAVKAQQSSTPLPRTIVTANGVKEVLLPLCPARMISLKDYVQELEHHGFQVLSAERVKGSNTSYEAILISQKH